MGGGAGAVKRLLPEAVSEEMMVTWSKQPAKMWSDCGDCSLQRLREIFQVPNQHMKI